MPALMPNVKRKVVTFDLWQWHWRGIYGNHQHPYNDHSLQPSSISRKLYQVNLGPPETFGKARWVVSSGGLLFEQRVKSQPSIALGEARVTSLDLEGLTMVISETQDDFLGISFSFQSSSRFYVLMWKRTSESYTSGGYSTFGDAGVHLKRIMSGSGPSTRLETALFETNSTAGHTELLWHHPFPWSPGMAYRWKILHRPLIGVIRVSIGLGSTPLVDSGNIYNDVLRGGRFGPFCQFLNDTIWADVKFRANETRASTSEI
ncbi:cartilage oligomeric matrix protein-like [Penaeus japonicus]|uniref:cartilage oligomeric matrix protein-like n=1 Tax=Penaeus japonicus TaxID=27405 RepID=UPI001C717B55|nr:cartilage oligomeric matrix protein-like [Penaeus japonicus]